MTTTYLPDATNYDDIPRMPDPATRYPDKAGYVLCPKCHGHGKWNLRLHAYGPAPGDPTGPRQHFQAACGQCWGWGWVDATTTDASCLHTFVSVAPDQPFRSWHTLECTSCKARKSYSSDD